MTRRVRAEGHRKPRPDRVARSGNASPARAWRAAGERESWSGRTPRALLLLVLATVALSQAWLVAPLRALPSPIHGGDLYYQLGCVQRILATGNPMASCSACETRPGYLPLYGTLVAAAARAGLGVETPERSMLVMSVVFKVAAVIAFTALLAPLAGPSAAIAGAALWYASHPDPILRYTSFAAEIIVPLFLLALLRLLGKPGAGRALALALAIGAAGYAHAVVFIGSVAITGLSALGWALTAPRDAAARRALIWSAVAAIVGVAIALGYWWQPIFVLHGHTSPHYTEWNGGPTLKTWAARWALAARFFAAQLQFSSPAAVAVLGVPVGFAFAWRRRNEPEVRAGALIAGACLMYVFHYFVTEPLLGVNFVPEYAASMLWGSARWIAIGFAVAGLVSAARSAGVRRAVAVAVTVAGVLMAAGATGSLAETDEMVSPRSPLPVVYDDLRRWVRANTRPDDVFLSSQELSFMLSALTGRQVLVTRRAQNDAFADMDARARDAALILYGSDDSLRRQRLSRWKVRYLLWTERWLESEFGSAEVGDSTGYVDPLLYFEDPVTDSLLTRAGVRLSHVTGWVDPVLRGPDVKRFPLAIVSQDNYRSPERPWSAALDPMLRERWSYPAGGRKAAVIYEIEPATARAASR